MPYPIENIHEDIRGFVFSERAETRQKGDELEFKYCPICGGGQHKDQWTFSLNTRTGACCCQRASCGYKGHFVELCRDCNYPLEEPSLKEYKHLPQPKREIVSSQAAINYLGKRGISAEVVQAYRVTTKTGDDSVLVFPFLDEKGKLIFLKYRNTNFKKGDRGSKEWSEKDARPILFGMNMCKDRKQLVVTEGQIDSLSVAEAGINNAVSVPCGALGRTWIDHDRKFVESFGEILVFGDNEKGKITLVDMFCENFPDKLIKAVRNVDYLGEKDANDILQTYGPEAVRKCVELAEIVHDPAFDLPAMSDDYRPTDLSDAGNAEAFTKTVKGRALWCDATGWHCWDGMRFAQDDHAATALAIKWAQGLLAYAEEKYKREFKTDPDTGKAVVPEATRKLLQHAQKTRSAVSIQNFMNLSKAYLHIRADQLDSQWWNLNTPAGIVDLRTGKIGPHDPAALFTTITKCSPSDENMEMWTAALDIASCQDSDWIDYDNRIEGSMLFGKIFKEGILIKKGPGRNMKSTLTNAALQVLGDYGGTIDSAILTTDRQNRGAALATLRGKRMVVCGELEEGQRLSVATLKKLASTDPLTIEAKYKQPETITPSHHLILYTNFLPRVGSTDTGTWRRISVLPYDATIPEGDGDIPNYADELVNKAGGAILKWLIDGAMKFYQAGCRIEVPECVREATEAYRAGEDWLQGFISERCIVDRDVKDRAGVLYDEYKDYAVSIGDYCRRGTDFVKAMELAGFRSVTVNGKKYWLGISINYAESSSAATRVV